MKKVILYCGLGLLSISPSFASDALTMEDLLNSTNPLPLLKKEATNNPINASFLRDEIKKETFYDLAQGARFGVIKRSELISYCSGTEFEKGSFKAATQGAKKEEEKQVLPTLRRTESTRSSIIEEEKHILPTLRHVETTRSSIIEEVKLVLPTLRHVEFKKGNDVEEEQKILEDVKEAMLENALVLGKQKEFEEKIQQAEASIKVAQENYDNLSIVIIGMREDLKEIRGFQHFNPNAHNDATPEAYLSALHSALPRENVMILDGTSKQLVQLATNLLNQANENLAQARHDLEKINRELLAFTQ